MPLYSTNSGSTHVVTVLMNATHLIVFQYNHAHTQKSFFISSRSDNWIMMLQTLHKVSEGGMTSMRVCVLLGSYCGVCYIRVFITVYVLLGELNE